MAKKSLEGRFKITFKINMLQDSVGFGMIDSKTNLDRFYFKGRYAYFCSNGILWS